MSDLTELLERFNRKERFIVFEQALTEGGAARLNPRYRLLLNEALDSKGVCVPERPAFVAIDYHLNWLWAALEVGCGWWHETPELPMPLTHPTASAFMHNQEDIDLLVVWDEAGTTHVLMVEAKAHSGWTNKQMASKVKRLQAIFGETGLSYPNVSPHLVLTSFAAPSGKLQVNGWPSWTTNDGHVMYAPLNPPATPRLIVGRTDADGHAAAVGGHVHVREAHA
jgi:hypothetical protein